MAQYLMLDSFNVDKLRLDIAESQYQEILAKKAYGESSAPGASSLVSEIAKARQQIQQTLDGGDVAPAPAAAGGGGAIEARLSALEQENKALKQSATDLQSVVKQLENRIAALEGGKPAAAPAPAKAAAPKKEEAEEEDDDDFDLFGSDDDDDEEEERERVKAERVAAYNERKSKKAVLIAKSSILLDVKPWDDETDMAEMERNVRTIVKDGLMWGASKLVEIGYGIKKLQIMCIVEDDKISVDELSEEICEFEDFVQSVDIAAFSKI